MIERRDDPTTATHRERYGEDITAQLDGKPFRQRLALVLSRLFQPVYRRLFTGRGHFVSRLEARLFRPEPSRQPRSSHRNGSRLQETTCSPSLRTKNG